jgi:hypothetical protein
MGERERESVKCQAALSCGDVNGAANSRVTGAALLTRLSARLADIVKGTHVDRLDC